ncbi:cytochrome b561 [Rhodopseudomonas rhenobacensis]|uniref:Cytochrome b561 n=1 Tax=Rhodopseudomonas rhenobacensis TaxID=87461 RepID=A0A7W7Z1S9_9BRAD|nr:cytochrome b [Rhodopseudomonas rhenobacensis]MBB5046449.1 cytochrome b561 [Rhodopseudomonas rhenobacensis]
MTRSRYTGVAIGLHWLIAALIVALIVIGLTMAHAPIAMATKFQLYQLHKSIGISVLGLAVLRVLWRLTHRPPALPERMPQLERKAAAGSHALLYLFMIGLPLTGWALVSASPLKIPTVLFGVLSWPDLPWLPHLADKARWSAVFDNIHAYGAFVLIALIGLHSAAALRHHFVVGDDVLHRMLPGVKPAGKTASDGAPSERTPT